MCIRLFGQKEISQKQQNKLLLPNQMPQNAVNKCHKSM